MLLALALVHMWRGDVLLCSGVVLSVDIKTRPPLTEAPLK